ncbi:uncharacterized protein [Aegilops tauschii subsp. strangulata]|uniref:uncharacterized protein n=1 Tax=Aegilops tauschii subsp. strangulata TaxID=200361 RepID=UPI003CC8BBF5
MYLIMDRSWIRGTLFSREYVNGVKEFMNLIQAKFSEDEEILCPCRECLNRKYWHEAVVNKHILTHGMESTYTHWIYHGEDFNADVIEHLVDVHDSEDGNNGADRFQEMFGDLRTSVEQDQKETKNGDGNNYANPSEIESFLKNVRQEAKRHLYHGCTKFSRFSFVVNLLHLKSCHRITNSAFTDILKLLAEAFPQPNTLPKSYDEAKNLLKELGLGYESIHVCINNCVLFRKQYARHDNCPICGMSRWKDPARKKIPQKVLRHFPLLPRLKRMFLSKKASREAQWHKPKRQPSEKEMSHPADGDSWQDFDKKYPKFAEDARNMRLGIATDGFNPFGNFNTTYSMWPVFVVPYNLPPWACMDQPNFMMALLIPGPKSPGKHFDVFLQPLVEDLLELWKGVHTYDAREGKMFDLHAAVLWCIHDYPALSTLSGRTTRGYVACIHCDKHPLSYGLRHKIGYIGHYRFLPKGHRLRRNNEFVGLHERNNELGKFSKEELQAELEKVRPRRQEESRKRKRSDLGSKKAHVPIWSRRVCLWDLDYWDKLKLRHNLDVMHIEKNICENLIGTILNMEGKTKDTLNARLDLQDLNIKEELHLRKDGNSYEMPQARMFKDELKRKRVPNIAKELQKEFQTWFKNYIMRLRDEHSEEIDEDLFSLACEPNRRVRKYSSCIVNGIRYSTLDRDSNKRTQNSGVMAEGEHGSKVIDFYGTLKEIIQLDYNSNYSLDGSETKGAPFTGLAYQEEECCDEEGMRTPVSEHTSEKPLHRDNEQGIIFEADVIARLMKEKNTEVYEGGNEDEDDTGMEYCSKDKGGGMMDVDSNDE